MKRKLDDINCKQQQQQEISTPQSLDKLSSSYLQRLQNDHFQRKSRIQHNEWAINSSIRDQALDSRPDFYVPVPQELQSSKGFTHGLSAIDIVSIYIPLNLKNITAEHGCNKLLFWEGGSSTSYAPTSWTITIPEGNYDTVDDLVEMLNSRVATAMPFTSSTNPAVQVAGTGEAHNTSNGLKNSYRFAYDEITNKITMRSVVHVVNWGIQCPPTMANVGKSKHRFNNEHRDINVSVLSTTGGGAKVLSLSFPLKNFAHNIGPNYLFDLEITSDIDKSKRLYLQGCCQYESTFMTTNAISSSSITYTTKDAVTWAFASDDTSLKCRLIPFANSYGSMALILGFTVTPRLPYTSFLVTGIQDGNVPPTSVTLTYHNFSVVGPCDFQTADDVYFDNFSTLSSEYGPESVVLGTNYHSFNILKTDISNPTTRLTSTSIAYVYGMYAANECVKLKYPSFVNLKITFDDRVIGSTLTFEGHKRSSDLLNDPEATAIIPITVNPTSILSINRSTFTFPLIKFETPVPVPSKLRFQIFDEDGISIPTSADWGIVLDPTYHVQ